MCSLSLSFIITLPPSTKVCGDTEHRWSGYTEFLHLFAQFLDVVADDAVVDVHVGAVVEQIQTALHIDLQSRGNMMGFLLVLLEQGVV